MAIEKERQPRGARKNESRPLPATIPNILEPANGSARVLECRAAEPEPIQPVEQPEPECATESDPPVPPTDAEPVSVCRDPRTQPADIDTPIPRKYYKKVLYYGQGPKLSKPTAKAPASDSDSDETESDDSESEPEPEPCRSKRPEKRKTSTKRMAAAKKPKRVTIQEDTDSEIDSESEDDEPLYRTPHRKPAPRHVYHFI
jgi:hypothetical protein